MPLTGGTPIRMQRRGSRMLISRRQVGVHVQRCHPDGFCTGDIRLTVVADHQTAGGIKLLLLHQRAVEPDVRLAALMIGGKVHPVQLRSQPQVCKLIGRKDPLGIAQQPEAVPVPGYMRRYSVEETRNSWAALTPSVPAGSGTPLASNSSDITCSKGISGKHS